MLRQRGFYSRTPAVGPRLLCLNTDAYSPRAYLDPEVSPDPYGQLTWLEAELEATEAANATALILGHIPPALDSFSREPMWQPDYAAKYWAILARHPAALAGQLFGHLHTEQFRVWRAESGGWNGSHSAPGAASAAAIAESPPLLMLASISPIFYNNPTFHTLQLARTGGDTVAGIPPREGHVGHSGMGHTGMGHSGMGHVGPMAAWRLVEHSSFYTDISSRTPHFAPLYNSTELLALATDHPEVEGGVPLARPLTNQRYARLAHTFEYAGGSTAFASFYADYDARYEPPNALTCVTADQVGDMPHAITHAHIHESCPMPDAIRSATTAVQVGDKCTKCTDGCRRAWTCLLNNGTRSDAYTACLAGNGSIGIDVAIGACVAALLALGFVAIVGIRDQLAARKITVAAARAKVTDSVQQGQAPSGQPDLSITDYSCMGMLSGEDQRSTDVGTL